MNIDARIRQLGELFFELDQPGREIALAIYRRLSAAERPSISDLAADTRLDEAAIAAQIETWPGVFRDDEGRIIGFWGSSVEPVSEHRITVDGVTTYTWCAWDALFIPIILERAATVRSVVPGSDEPVELVVAADGTAASTADVYLSFVLPDDDFCDKGIVSNFCHFIFFFNDRASAEDWTRDRERTFVLPLAQAVAAARHKIRYEWGDEFRPAIGA
jgi:alkylmercury lyase